MTSRLDSKKMAENQVVEPVPASTTSTPRAPKAQKAPGKGTKKAVAVAVATATANQAAEAPISPQKSHLRTDYLIQARWTTASFIRQVIDSIKDLIRETNMDWDDTGIRIQGMDAAHIALSNIFLSSEDCECFHVSEGITVGIDLTRISKILSTANATDSCEFFIQSDQESNLSILIQSDDNSKQTLFEIPLLEIDMEFLNIPETSYEHQISIPAAEVPTAIRDMAFLGDNAEFTVNSDEFIVKVHGEFGKCTRSWKQGACIIQSTGDGYSQLFPIKYVTLALKATSTTETLVLEMSDGAPLRIRCLMGKKSSIVNFVAPKIREDDDDA